MSADDLWLIREREDHYYPVHAFASPIIEGNMPEEPDLLHDPAFLTVTDALDWCLQRDREDPTEYGTVLDTERGIAELKAIKDAGREDLRIAMEAFGAGLKSALKDAERGNIPMPGDFLTPAEGRDKEATGVVIASVYYREGGDDSIPEDLRDELHNTDIYTILLLNDEPPHYTVGTGYWDARTWTWIGSEDHTNIVLAVNGDNYPNVIEGTSHTEGPRKNGYVDMGGDC